MKISQKVPRIVGILFIIGTVSGILSALFTAPVLDQPDFLTSIYQNQTQYLLGVSLVLIMGLSLAMVPVMMYPIFKTYNPILALGAVLFRGALEMTAYIAMVISFLLLMALSQEYASVGTGDVSQFQVLGTLLRRSNDLINPILEIVFSLGALMFYFIFYQSRLLPRWLSIWGVAGAAIYFVAGWLELFSIPLSFLLAPLALQEMVLAIWLIVKGFNSHPNPIPLDQKND